MAVRGDASSITQKWKQRTGGATQQVIEGVKRTTEAPGQKAAAQKAVYLAQVQAKVDKWERNVGAVTLQSWQESTIAGAARIGAGVEAKAPKFESFMREFIPHIERGQQNLKSMPRGDINANLARMVANARHMADFKRTGNR